MRVGYQRVSSKIQSEARQLDGIEDLDKTYCDKVSGKDTQRPELQAMLDFVREGDTVVVHSLDRLARNLDDLRRLVTTLTDKGVRVEFVKEGLTFSGDDSPMSTLLLSVMGAFAEFERRLILDRQREGIALAKERGAYRNRKRKLTKAQVIDIRERVTQGEAKAALAREYGVNRSTIYDCLREDDLPPETERAQTTGPTAPLLQQAPSASSRPGTSPSAYTPRLE